MHAAVRHRWKARFITVVILVAAADFLFFEGPFGCSAAIYALLLLAATLVVGAGSPKRRGVTALSLIVLVLAGALVEQPTPLALFLTLVGLCTLALTERHGWTGDVVVWSRRLLAFWRRGFIQWARDLQVTVKQCSARLPGTNGVSRLRQWLPGVGLGVVFLALFALANPVLADWMHGAMRRVFNLGDGMSAPRVLSWIAVAILAWALLRTRAPLTRSAPRLEAENLISSMTLVRSLWVFNLLFLLQNSLDVRHLMFDVELPEGVTYAGYARRGAYPLLAAALLSAGFIMTAFRSKDDAFGVGARRLVYVFLLQNVVLTVFAMFRLMHYVDAYSLSRMRVAAFLWMGLVAVGLALIFVRIATRRSNRWLLGANAIAVAVLLGACCFPNIDRMIADFNVSRCKEIRGRGQPIDFQYLKLLDVDALPALRRLQAESSAFGVQAAAGALADSAREKLDEQLADWRGWTLRRQRLQDADRASKK